MFCLYEAQEFVADLTNLRGIDRECSEGLETLLRQGRKYADRPILIGISSQDRDKKVIARYEIRRPCG